MQKGLATVFALLTVFAAIYAIWLRVTEPRVPPFDPVGQMRAVDNYLEKMTPREGWQLWIEHYRPLAERGFAPFEHRDAAAIEQLAARQRLLQKTLWVVAAICTLVALAAALLPRFTWPSR
jgi:hypothetical protein